MGLGHATDYRDLWNLSTCIPPQSPLPSAAPRLDELYLPAIVSEVDAGPGVGLKALFMRPRPDVVAHLVDVTSTSFPSGHATNSAVVYLTLGALLARTQTSRRVRAYLMAVAIALTLTLTVGFSRVYLGVHWPTDVVAGWCVGAAWATSCGLLARFLQRRRTLEQPTAD
ncbi:MAG TPA: phosphatase PAP2 family protein [Allosphingosinicella sp.]|jgi:undecaprenyl-diphosphatase